MNDVIKLSITMKDVARAFPIWSASSKLFFIHIAACKQSFLLQTRYTWSPLSAFQSVSSDSLLLHLPSDKPHYLPAATDTTIYSHFHPSPWFPETRQRKFVVFIFCVYRPDGFRTLRQILPPYRICIIQLPKFIEQLFA